MKKSTKHNLKWFTDRIGKNLYRKDTGKYHVRVSSEGHAKVLEMYQNDLNVYYSDKPFK